jgi:hypothetical protein
VHPTEIVGDYEITPVEMLTSDAGDALNAWLVKNGFGRVPKENQYFYVSKGVVFLALKIKKLAGAFTGIKPLHIVYKSDKAALPLKFSSHSGVFDAHLYTFTNSSLDRNELVSFRLQSSTGSVPIGRGKTPALDTLTGGKSGYLTRFEGNGYNAPGNSVKQLTDDPFIAADLAVRGNLWNSVYPYLLLLVAIAPFFFLRRLRRDKNAPRHS